LYLGVYGFNVYMTFAIGEHLLGVVDLFLLMPVLVMAWVFTTHPAHQATPADIAVHCRDFPHSPLLRLHTDTTPEQVQTTDETPQDVSAKPSELT
jgi:hypothetical protein